MAIELYHPSYVPGPQLYYYESHHRNTSAHVTLHKMRLRTLTSQFKLAPKEFFKRDSTRGRKGFI